MDQVTVRAAHKDPCENAMLMAVWTAKVAGGASVELSGQRGACGGGRRTIRSALALGLRGDSGAPIDSVGDPTIRSISIHKKRIAKL